jgi:hypothetical protein
MPVKPTRLSCCTHTIPLNPEKIFSAPMWDALGETVTHRTTCDGDKQYENFHNSLFSFLQLKIIADGNETR